MSVYIFDANALALMGQVEGAEWLERQQSAAESTGSNFISFKRAWDLAVELGETWSDNVDPKLVDVCQFSDGAIYGEGGYARYIVRSDGEIVLLRWSTRSEKLQLAVKTGFSVRL